MVTILSVGFTSLTSDQAGALHFAVDVHGAGAALADAAAVLGAGQPDLLAQRPQQRRVAVHLQVECLAVDVELSH